MFNMKFAPLYKFEMPENAGPYGITGKNECLTNALQRNSLAAHPVALLVGTKQDAC